MSEFFFAISPSKQGFSVAGEWTDKNIIHHKTDSEELYFFGVLINEDELLQHAKEVSNISKLLLALYRKSSNSFLEKLNGSFCIIIIDHYKRTIFLAANRFGDKRLYYNRFGNQVLISSNILTIANYLKNEGVSLTLNQQSAYQLLTYSYVIGSQTPVNDIVRLQPGHYVLSKELNDLEQKKYYYFPDPNSSKYTYNEAITNLDELFKSAVDLQFSYSKKYFGQKQFVTLSGGLDSRMTAMIAHDLGYKDFNFFTFSQTGYLDHTIPKEITRDLQSKLWFVPLDGGNFISQNYLEHSVDLLGGICSFTGGIHGASSLHKIISEGFDISNMGIVHTGQLGDVVVGNYTHKKSSEDPKLLTGGTSKILAHKLSTTHLQPYTTNEEFVFMNRGFNAILSGNIYYQAYNDVLSPFMENSFFDFCMSLPMKWRVNHKIYYDWVNKQYKHIRKYKKTGIDSYIYYPIIVLRHKEVAVNKLPQVIMQKLSERIKIPGLRYKPKYSMNPYAYYYSSNPNIPKFYNRYFEETIGNIEDKELRKDCSMLFKKGSFNEKSMVLTLLSTVRRIIN